MSLLGKVLTAQNSGTDPRYFKAILRKTNSNFSILSPRLSQKMCLCLLGKETFFSCWHGNGKDIIILLGGHKKLRTDFGRGRSGKLILSKMYTFPQVSRLW